ncbi:tripartite tricarboxylate transporter TctB family protein [Aureimonas fodinaquatilis]|uniref:Tripartite tricarboxylate transporter TctB family protein n=1 Tax=Aureimonas fodinaquatilis TaxID=2565783 RepID=A0A5B0E2H7_9HYPH|nr:tripartite tricarboxylate transporter TctB family protein [Aureimonas fodinaquatilis]KAA0971950.1 tripartite tricarboxylate transporter TctB family protein [Aureimonas fodinaquatilis]
MALNPTTTDAAAPGRSRVFNYVVAAIMVGVSAIIAHGTFFSGRSRTGVSMPLVFPSVLIVLLIGLAALLVWQTAANKLPPPENAPIPLRGHMRAAIILCITIAYPLAMPIIGFPLATAAALTAFSLALGERRYWLIALYAIGFAAALYAIFIMALRVPLPLGFFE